MSISSGDRSHSRSLSGVGEALTTKSSSIFVLAAQDGDIDSSSNAGYGVYFNDTRFLDRSTLRMDGERLAVLLSSADGGDSVCELTNPDIQLRTGETLGKNRIGVRRERKLGRDVVEAVTMTNFGSDEVQAQLTLDFAASFESMFEIRGIKAQKRGELHRPRWDGHRLCFRYDGADGRRRTTTVRFSPPPSAHKDSSVTFALKMKPGAKSRLRATMELRDDGPGKLERAPRQRTSSLLSGVGVGSDNPLFNRVLARSFDDLRTLVTLQRKETFFAAGVPWFVALFGRDSLIAALQTMAYDSSIAAHTLELLARYQGTKEDDYHDEQPGKILHELRVGEMANLEEVPQTPYYGTVDATPIFIIVLAEYVRWTGDMDLWRRLRGNVERALTWIEKYGDSDGDDFIDYQSRSKRGSHNQGWKDSWNGIRNRDGSLAEPPIALVEVQGYVYRAKREAAWLFERDGDVERGGRLRAEADRLRQQFSEAYWMPSRRYFAVAIQKGERRVESITSNPGQALWSGIVAPDRVADVAQVLMSDEMFSGWGVRTLAEDEAAYNPIDYQVGSVWPHDNSFIAAGLKRYGYDEEASRIFSGIFQAATYFGQYRLPEVFAGISRERYDSPVRYPVACSPQAWSAGALPYLLQTVLGLEPNAFENELEIRRPVLPHGLGEVTLSGLAVGKAKVDLAFRRTGDATFVSVRQHQGNLKVRISAR